MVTNLLSFRPELDNFGLLKTFNFIILLRNLDHKFPEAVS